MASSSPSLMDTLFQRTLDDIIKGLRHHLHTGESTFISKAVEEIRREIKSTDLHTKSIALHKLSYLNSLHFVNMSWAAFHAIECISSPVFSHKKVGYLSISQSFNESTPVLLLITNQLRKDLKSNNEFEVSLALDCLSKIGTLDLCRDLTSEVFTLMSSSKVFVKKKAIGVLLRVFGKYPDAVRVCFKRLVESLECSDPQILCAAIGVFCELTAKDPRSYLPLAPEFYKVLVDSRNNWVLIKVLKIFAKLAPLEPRLAKRVVEPICEHMQRTGAKSLMFECIRTVVSSFSEFESAVKLAAAKIRELLVDDDPNLKYLGLHALSILAPNHLWAVLENKEVVIKSLSDGDPNVKLESLRLVMAMVSESNVVDICRVLINYALKSDPEFCNEILGSILSTCSRNVYDIIDDFDWYVSLLGEMSRIPHCHKGEEIENQLVDIGMRVKDARPELVRVGRELLIDPALLGNPFLHRMLSAAAWVCGEYVKFSRNPIELIEALLQPRTSLLPPSIRTVYVQSVFKILIFCLYNYIYQRENAADDMTSEASILASKKEHTESSDLTNVETVSYEQDKGFISKDSNQSFEDPCGTDSGDVQTLASAFVTDNGFTNGSIVKLLNLIELCFVPLAGSYDVEIQDRVQNTLSFINLIKHEVSQCSLSKKSNLEELNASNAVKLLHDAFFKELGPVSTSSQDRVPISDGLMLKENLSDLDELCREVQLPSTSSFFLGGPYFGEGFGVSFSDVQSKEEPEPSSESTSLLAEHRKRHVLYYLPQERNEIPGNDYPPANDPKLGTSSNNDAEDLVKLADQSLVAKRKPSHAKTRPVVVKLDEGDTAPVTISRLDTSDDLLTDAVREVLLGDESLPAPSQASQHDKLSSNRKGKAKLNADLPESKENFIDGQKPNDGNPSSRKSKHRSHGKDRSKRSSATNDAGGEREDIQEKGKHKSRLHHGRNKSKQRASVPLDLVAQTADVPDFLL